MLNILPLFSGSSGNCTYIKYGSDEILIDAGVSYRSIAKALCNAGTDISSIRAVFVTHEHTDHVKGLEMIAKKHRIPIYINSASAAALGYHAENTLYDCIRYREAGETVETENFNVGIFKTPHDSRGSVGYRITSPDGKSVGYATDIGYVTKGVAGGLFGCETVIIEANHDLNLLRNGGYPYFLKQRILSDRGHLSNDACGAFLPHLVRCGTQNIYLAHLSQDNNRPDLALKTAVEALRTAGVSPDDVCLSVARRASV